MDKFNLKPSERLELSLEYIREELALIRKSINNFLIYLTTLTAITALVAVALR